MAENTLYSYPGSENTKYILCFILMALGMKNFFIYMKQTIGILYFQSPDNYRVCFRPHGEQVENPKLHVQWGRDKPSDN